MKESNYQVLINHVAAGDFDAALLLVVKWRLPDPYRDPIQRSWAIKKNQTFYEELGQDPVMIAAEGVEALKQFAAYVEEQLALLN